jgi:glucosylceramidase
MTRRNRLVSLKAVFVFSLTFLLISSIAFNSSAFDAGKLRISTQSALWGAEQNLAIEDSRTVTNYVTVDTATKYQTVEFFGGCFNELGWKALLSLPAARSDSAIASLFDTVTGCKFNMCRMPIGASDYGLSWYSLNETVNDTLMTKINIDRDKQYLNLFIKAAMKYNPNLTMWASPWSPPTWMKTNGNYPGANSGFKQQATYLKAYALYFEKAIKLYRDDGIRVTALAFQNEPFSASGYPGCLWNMTQCRDFIKNYLGPQFDADQVGADIWTPTMNNGDVNNFKTMLDDAGSAKYIKAACFQWEGKNAVAGIHQSYPNLRILQTENECGNGSNDWAYAETPTYYYMKFYFDNGATGYFQWNMILDNSGKSTWGWLQNAMISIDTAQKKVRYNPQYYVVKHFSYYVMPGAKKLKSSGNFANQVAFKNPDGSVVVVLDNTGTSQMALGITVGGIMVNTQLPGKSFATVVFSNATEAGSPDRKTLPEKGFYPCRIQRTNGTLTFMAQGNLFSARIIGLDGSVLKTAYSVNGKAVVFGIKGIPAGAYILKRGIDGRMFSEAVLLNQ